MFDNLWKFPNLPSSTKSCTDTKERKFILARRSEFSFVFFFFKDVFVTFYVLFFAAAFVY